MSSRGPAYQDQAPSRALNKCLLNEQTNKRVVVIVTAIVTGVATITPLLSNDDTTLSPRHVLGEGGPQPHPGLSPGVVLEWWLVVPVGG